MKDEAGSLDRRLQELQEICERESERLRMGEQVWVPAVIRFTEEMKGRYGEPECAKCRLWHQALLGSTPVDGLNPNFDLPGGEIEHFIREVMPSLEPEEDDD
jgi:hypothetical protein